MAASRTRCLWGMEGRETGCLYLLGGDGIWGAAWGGDWGTRNQVDSHSTCWGLEGRVDVGVGPCPTELDLRTPGPTAHLVMLCNQDQGMGLLLRHVWPESQAVRLRCGSVSDTVGGHPQSLAMLEAHDSLPVDAGFPFSHPPTALVLYSASTENHSVMYFHYWVTNFAYERKNQLLCWMKIIQLTSKWQSQDPTVT